MTGAFFPTVLREQRTDRATRTIGLANGPVIEYDKQGSWRKPEQRHIRWQVTEVEIVWWMGRVKRVSVRGLRLKKDGTAGLVKEWVDFRPNASFEIGEPLQLSASWDHKHSPMPWLNVLVTAHATVPAFTTDDDD